VYPGQSEFQLLVKKKMEIIKTIPDTVTSPSNFWEKLQYPGLLDK